jgi:UDP-3-O-[3-hydroxymyristoyl] glucosamine N-acyltransferase
MAEAAALGDARFFARSGAQSLADVAACVGGVLTLGSASTGLLLERVAPLQTAHASDLSFLDNRKYIPALRETRAGAVIVHPDMAAHVPDGCAAIVTAQPYVGWARAAALFHPEPPATPGIHPSAVIDPTATIDPSAEIGPFVTIGARVEIGPRTRVAPCAHIGAGTVIGPDCRIGPHASVTHAMLGARVYLYPGARVGQEGFGFATDMTRQGPRFLTVPQLGRVLIGDDVELGANSCIDRGSAQDTVVGAGTRIDNLVQVAHNVTIGRCCVLVAQSGIAGSTVLEDFVVIAAQVGVLGHLTIGRGARVGGQSGVSNDVPAGTEVFGTPAQPKLQMMRQIAWLKRHALARPASLSSNTAGQEREAPAPGPAAGTD